MSMRCPRCRAPADLAKLVQQMRAAQKAYFRSRKPHDLSLARDLERRVDLALQPEPPAQARCLWPT